MTYINVFNFLEDIMDKKYETDMRDIKDHRQMRSMTEFVMESLQRQFGIQALALKFLRQVHSRLLPNFQRGAQIRDFLRKTSAFVPSGAPALQFGPVPGEGQDGLPSLD